MDTGLGAKAYSIIEQGKIGMILSSRPTDRRQLIEEAAGHHQVQGAAPRRRVEARRGAAEPHPARRHRLRGREAARVAQAPGGQGAALPAAARRDAALGEGAVRAPLPRTWPSTSSRRARGWPTRGRRGGLDGAARRGRDRPRPRAHRAGRGGAGRRPRREAAHARELDVNRRQQQLALDAQQAAMLETRAAELDAELARARGTPRAGSPAPRGSARGHRRRRPGSRCGRRRRHGPPRPPTPRRRPAIDVAEQAVERPAPTSTR